MSSTSQLPVFDKELLVYVPAYNCADTIVDVVNSIPNAVADRAQIVVVDNCSNDGTAEHLLAVWRQGKVQYPFFVVRPTENLGYAGSQKLIYAMATRQSAVRWIIMLHGDGQYPSELIANYLEHLDGHYGLVHGYRSKRKYGSREETPWLTFLTIRILGYLETLVTHVPAKEWHSGFVMYSTDFLRKVSLQTLIDTPHIDGHLLYAAHALGFAKQEIPIYKRYRGLKAFSGMQAVRYAMSVLSLAYRFRQTRNDLTARGLPALAEFTSTAVVTPCVQQRVHAAT